MMELERETVVKPATLLAIIIAVAIGGNVAYAQYLRAKQPPTGP